MSDMAYAHDPLQWPHGELRPQSHEFVLRGVYSSVHVPPTVVGVNFTDVIVLGAIAIEGTNITGRIFAPTGSGASPGGNTLTITECGVEELRRRALNSRR